MNRDVRDRWVAALLSGDYVQGPGQLAVTLPDGVTRFCCLGVLCELAVADGVVERRELRSEVAEGVVFVAYGGATKFPPAEVVAWAGLDAPNPDVLTSRGDEVTLGHANDSLEWDFARIADVIEVQL